MRSRQLPPAPWRSQSTPQVLAFTCSPGLRWQIVLFESELRDLVMSGPFTSAAKQAHACPESFSRRPHADRDRHHSVRDVCAHALAMRLRGFDTFACGSPSHGTGRKAQTRTRRMSRAGSAGSLDGQLKPELFDCTWASAVPLPGTRDDVHWIVCTNLLTRTRRTQMEMQASLEKMRARGVKISI